jgi:hypothetical protein
MSILHKILNSYPDEGLLKVDGFDDAIIGVSSDIRIVYSLDKIIDILMEHMSEDDAIEYFYFNIEAAYLGEKMPIYVKIVD